MRLKGSDIINAIIDWCNWKVLVLLFRNIPPVLRRSDKKRTIEIRSLLETAKCVLFFNKNIYKPYCFKWHHLRNFAEEIFAIDQFWQNFAEEIFAIDQFWNFFAEEIFANKGQNRKNKFRKNFFRKRFLPLRYAFSCITYVYRVTESSMISKMLFIGSHSNLFLRLNKMRNFAEFIFAIGRIFAGIKCCGTNFCDLGPKSQKLMPQHFMPAKINALKVCEMRILFLV